MKKHILIVDDEADIRDLLNEFLSGNDYRVTTVGSAGEAMLAGQSDPPDLIISDLQLENTDGLEMIANLKKAIPGKPVILLTGVLFDPEVVEGVLSTKVDSYLMKTTPLSRILETVRNLLKE